MELSEGSIGTIADDVVLLLDDGIRDFDLYDHVHDILCHWALEEFVQH